MAIRGQKRSMKAHAVEAPSAKKRCAGIAKVLAAGAGGFPGKLLADMASGALLTYKDDRHPLQVKAVAMVGEALSAARDAKKKALAERDTEVAGAAREKVTRAKHLEEAQANVTRLAEEVVKKKAELTRAGGACEAAAEVLSAAKKAQRQGEKELSVTEREKAGLDVAVSTLQAAKVSNAEKAVLMKLAKHLHCDKPLLDSLASTLKESAESRSSFGQATIDQFTATLTAKSAELASTIDAGAAGRNERAAAVQSAEDARKAASERQVATEKALKDLQEQHSHGKAAVKLADKRVEMYLHDMKVLMDGLDSMRKDLAAFGKGPIADFAELKELAPPPPVVEEVALAPAEQAACPAQTETSAPSPHKSATESPRKSATESPRQSAAELPRNAAAESAAV